MKLVEIRRTGARPAKFWARQGSRKFYALEHERVTLLLDMTYFSNDLGEAVEMDGDYEVQTEPAYVSKHGHEVFLTRVPPYEPPRGSLALVKTDAPFEVIGDAKLWSKTENKIVRVYGRSLIAIRDPHYPWVVVTENGREFAILSLPEYILERLAYREPLEIKEEE